jgi:Cell wall-active antibiotics response 4TMS YvqF
VRLLRGLLLFKLGFWAGMFASATLLKRMLPSRGDEESDEIALVAIRNGIELKSRSRAFRGGSLFSWFGGIAIDLRDVELAENAHLDLHTAFGGIAIRVPLGWRVESNVTSLAGGVAVDAPMPEAADAPTLRLDGFSAFGGIAVGAKPAES